MLMDYIDNPGPDLSPEEKAKVRTASYRKMVESVEQEIRAAQPFSYESVEEFAERLFAKQQTAEAMWRHEWDVKGLSKTFRCESEEVRQAWIKRASETIAAGVVTRLVFPVNPDRGMKAFFAPAIEPDRISHYGTVHGKLSGRILVKIHNATQNMMFDPQTGVARPFRQKFRLIMLLQPGQFKRLHYNDAISLAQDMWDRMLADESRNVVT